MASTTNRVAIISLLVAALVGVHSAVACSSAPEQSPAYIGSRPAPPLTLITSLQIPVPPVPDKDVQIDDALRQLSQLDNDSVAGRRNQRQVNGLKVDVLFASDEIEISDSDRQRIRIVAELLMQFDTAAVSIFAYADERGSETYNDMLSLDRAFEVADILNDLGVAQRQISTLVMGEAGAEATPGDIDAYTLDRRVSLLVEIAATSPSSLELMLSDIVSKGTD